MWRTTMKVTLVGGLDRLAPHYREAAKSAGHDLTVFSTYRAGMDDRLGMPEAIVVLTGMVSHTARNHARFLAQSLGIPFVQSHSPGLSAFRGALAHL